MLQSIIDGRTDRVFDYLEQGNPANAHDEHGTALIRWCAYHGDVSAIRYLLEKGEKLASLGSNLDLNGAVFHGHWQLVAYLIDQGADANHPLSGTGETPLHAALCSANRPVYDRIIALLLEAGASPNVTTTPGMETGSFMRDARTRGETPLHRAAAFGSERSIGLLLDAGARINATDCNGDTPLTWASWHLRPPTVLRLLCFGEHRIHPDNHSTYDHGRGWSQNEQP